MRKTIEVHNRVSDFNSYRAARVKSLFNAENGCNFDLVVEADLDFDWNIGVVVGPSGSGKTSIGKMIFGENKIYDYHEGWERDKPIIDCIAPKGDFNEVTGALANVGLGDVPAWLRPFHVLSNGEQFRAGLAKVVCEKPSEIVIDEFTSVIDRQIAKIGSQAFQKAWRRSNPNGKVVLLTPHYDILEWVQPDWIIDTKTKTFSKEQLRRPDIVLDIWQVDQSYWKFYKPHYYLDLPEPVAAQHFIGTVDGELACHVVVCPKFESLKRLYEDGHEITGVAPPPQKRLKDKMVGYAQLKGIPVISDCEKLISDNIPDGTELVISAHSHWIVSDKILDKCKYGGIGFHPSLLPRHRGQDAVRWAVHMKDAVTGATIYDLRSNTCDGGDILMQKTVFIDPKEDYHELWARLFPIGVDLVSKAVRLIEKGAVDWEKQDERFATWEPSWDRPRLKRNELVMLGGGSGDPNGEPVQRV